MRYFPKKYLVLGVIALSAFGLMFLYSTSNLTSFTSTNPAPKELLAGRLPIRLKIPDLNVDAAIEYVGLTADGAMDTPKAPENVAWYNLGPRPGQTGSAVLAGHLNWKDGKDAVFSNLNKLRPGDKLEVLDDQGKSIVFMVRESRLYKSDAYVPEVFTSENGTHLNLITCTGVWNKSKQSYTERLVVFTDIVK
jgi:LPXTG-site transpeptidase (sortase) family protein